MAFPKLDVAHDAAGSRESLAAHAASTEAETIADSVNDKGFLPPN